MVILIKGAHVAPLIKIIFNEVILKMTEKIVSLDCFRQERENKTSKPTSTATKDDVAKLFNFINNIKVLLVHHGFLVHRIVYSPTSHYCFLSNPDTKESFYAQIAISDGNPTFQILKKKIGPLDLFQAKSCKSHRLLSLAPCVLLAMPECSDVRLCINGEGFLNYISSNNRVFFLEDNIANFLELVFIDAKTDELNFEAFKLAVKLAKENNLVIKDFKLSEGFTLFDPVSRRNIFYKITERGCNHEN